MPDIFRNGFFYPGDLAVKRQDGRIRILGRIADVLNVRGNKIAVAPIEQTIQNALMVAEVCVFSGTTNPGAEELVVAVKSDRALSKSELEQALPHLPWFPLKRFAVMKDFPRSETGLRKTNRRALRQLVFN